MTVNTFACTMFLKSIYIFINMFMFPHFLFLLGRHIGDHYKVNDMRVTFDVHRNYLEGTEPICECVMVDILPSFVYVWVCNKWFILYDLISVFKNDVKALRDYLKKNKLYLSCSCPSVTNVVEPDSEYSFIIKL